jgi:hypothetical protein
MSQGRPHPLVAAIGAVTDAARTSPARTTSAEASAAATAARLAALKAAAASRGGNTRVGTGFDARPIAELPSTTHVPGTLPVDPLLASIAATAAAQDLRPFRFAQPQRKK